jgi:hypothetical protein
LTAPLDAGLLGRIDGVWDQIESAIRKVWVVGYQGARDLLERAGDEAEKLIANSGRMATSVRQMLADKLQEYLGALMDAVLAQVKPSIKVGTNTIPLRSVDMARRVGLAGSLKATLTGIAELTGSGEITVTASYGPQGRT